MPNGKGNGHNGDDGKVAWIFESRRPSSSRRPRWRPKLPGILSEMIRVFRNVRIAVVPPAHLQMRTIHRKAWTVRALVIVFLLVQAVLGVFFPPMMGPEGGPYGRFLNYVSFSGELLLQGEVWRLLTAAFFHGGLSHLASNVIFFILLAPMVEKDQGWWRILLYFIAGSVGGFLMHGLFFASPVVGASAGISAIMGVYPRLYRGSWVRLQVFGSSTHMPMVPLIVFWLFMQFAMALLNPASSVSYVAHLGGFAAGYLLSGLIGGTGSSNSRVHVLRGRGEGPFRA